MNHILPKAMRWAGPQPGLDIYFGNLQQQVAMGSPTFEEAKRDYLAAEVGPRAYLNLG